MTNDEIFEAADSVVTDPKAIVQPSDLVRLRQAQGWSQSEISQRTKLSLRQVQALEAGDWSALPHGPFVAGALRLYGKLFDADVSALIRSLGHEVATAPIQQAAGIARQTGPTSVERTASRNRQWLLGGMVVLVLAIVVVVFYEPPHGLQPKSTAVVIPAATPPVLSPEPAPAVVPSPAATEVAQPVAASGAAPVTTPAAPSTSAPAVSAPPATAVASQAPASSPTASTPAAPAPVAAVAPSATPAAAAVSAAAAPPAANAVSTTAEASNVLQLNYRAESWVEIIQGDGTVLFRGTQQRDTVQRLVGRPPFKLKIGNASQVSLSRGGKDIDLKPYIAGEVAKLTLPATE